MAAAAVDSACPYLLHSTAPAVAETLAAYCSPAAAVLAAPAVADSHPYSGSSSADAEMVGQLYWLGCRGTAALPDSTVVQVSSAVSHWIAPACFAASVGIVVTQQVTCLQVDCCCPAVALGRLHLAACPLRHSSPVQQTDRPTVVGPEDEFERRTSPAAAASSFVEGFVGAAVAAGPATVAAADSALRLHHSVPLVKAVAPASVKDVLGSFAYLSPPRHLAAAGSVLAAVAVSLPDRIEIHQQYLDQFAVLD